MEDIIPAIPVPTTAVPRPLAQPSHWKVRLGVDLGGVLLAKLPPGQLPIVQTPSDIGVKMGHAPGAVDWLAECGLAGLSAHGIHKLENELPVLCFDFLLAQDGLLHAAGIPRANLVWTESRSDERWPFGS